MWGRFVIIVPTGLRNLNRRVNPFLLPASGAEVMHAHGGVQHCGKLRQDVKGRFKYYVYIRIANR